MIYWRKLRVDARGKETINDERTITLSQKDHENLSKLQPQIREIEKKRQIEEKKKKRKQALGKKGG